MSDDKAELANFFNKKKQKSKKKLIVDVADAPLSTSKDADASSASITADDVSNGNTAAAVKLSDNGWVDEVESEQITFETGGKTIVDMSENDTADTNETTDDAPLPIKFDAEKTWGGRVESTNDTATSATAAAQPATAAKYVVRAKQQGPPKLQDFPELGAAAAETESKKKPNRSVDSTTSVSSTAAPKATTTSSSSGGGEKYRPPMSRDADRRW